MAGNLARDIAAARTPTGGFSIWFLGQNSFVLKGSDGFTVAVDPYLSDWCATRGKSTRPTPKSRLFPPPLQAAELDADLVLLTHSHCDHADPQTLGALARNPRIRIAGSVDALRIAAEAGFAPERLRVVHAGEELAYGRPPGIFAAIQRLRAGQGESGVTIRVTFALPTDGTDLNHLGFLIRFPGGGTFWNTGDSAWCEQLPELAGAGVAKPAVMAVCINTGYGNLSHWDASKLAGAVGARFVVPAHWDLFPHNSLNPEPFRTSLAKNAPAAVYSLMERARRYDYTSGGFTLVP